MRFTKFLPVAILLAVYMVFTSSTCEPCETLALADLALDTFQSELASIEPDGNQIYSISAKIVNILTIANGCEGEDLNATAGPNGFLEQVVFSQNGTFNDAVIVNEMMVELQQLDPEEKALVSDAILVSRDGSYQMFTTVDSREEIAERREDNNKNENTIKSLSNVFVVSGTSNTPMFNDQGNPVYVIRKSAPKVRYEF